MKLSAVILDWAGTIVDYGSCAPVAALSGIFASAGIPITPPEARRSMGLAKKAHIASILDLPRVRSQWTQVRGKPPQTLDVDELYARFIPQQLEALQDRSTLIPGVPEAAGRMRSRGLKIGTTTGYSRAMLQHLVDSARRQGFRPDYSVCPDDVPCGRPAPFMCYLNALHLQVFPLWTMVKIGDTPADILEGLNAGMWTIGITRTGNEVGLAAPEWAAAGDGEKAERLATAQQVLLDAGAHYTIESVAGCDGILDRIEARLAVGRLPF